MILSASLFFFSCSNEVDSELNSTSYEFQKPPKEFLGLGFTLEIGRKSRDCKGLGVCAQRISSVTVWDLTINIDALRRQGNTLNVTPIPIKTPIDEIDPNAIRFDFLGEAYYDYIEEIFGEHSIILEEDVVLDSALINGLPFEISDDFRISEGIYPVNFDNESGFYYVTFYNNN